MRWIGTALIFATVGALLSCGGGGGGGSAPAGSIPSTSAGVRIVNATTDTLSDGANNYQFATVAPASITTYVAASPGTQTNTIFDATGMLLDGQQTISLAAGQYYTTLTYARSGRFGFDMIVDDLATPAAGSTLIYVDNTTVDAGALDIYLLSPGVNPQLGQATFQALQGASLSGVVPIPSISSPAIVAAGTYDVAITGAGNPNDIRQRLSGINLASSQPYLLAMTDTQGGVLVNSVVVLQRVASAQFLPATQARVRVLSVLPHASTVTVTIGTTSLPVQNAASVSTGAYSLVSDASTPAQLTVNTAGTVTSLSFPAGSFSSGLDYTILVYGAATAPLAVILADNNVPASASGSATFRLINAAVAGSLNLTFNGSVLATSVNYGAESSYAGSSVSLSDIFYVSGPGYSQSQIVVPASGGVYTVLVYDASLAPVIIRDR